ncbi:MAG: hypothetical protein LBF41_08485 [Deltaproteobacteria bacterium]|nr:hypothetical protein [Deltaproteobacteria bacterium]
MTPKDIDDFITVFSAKDEYLRGQAVIRVVAENGYEMDDYQKKVTIITFLSASCSVGQSNKVILDSVKKEFPEWNVTQSDVNLVKARNDVITSLVRALESGVPYTGLTADDVNNFVKIYYNNDINGQQKVSRELIANNTYTLEQLTQKMEVISLIAAMLYVNQSDDDILKALNQQLPDANITQGDIDAVKVRKSEVVEIAAQLAKLMGY